MSDLRPNKQVSATAPVIGHFFNFIFYFFFILFFTLNSSRFFCLHPVVSRERAGVQHTWIHMTHTLTGRRAQTLEYISVTKKWLPRKKRKEKNKKGEGSDYKSTTRVEAESESESSLSDSFLDVLQDFSLENNLSHAERKKGSLNNDKKKKKNTRIKYPILNKLDTWSCTLFPKLTLELEIIIMIIKRPVKSEGRSLIIPVTALRLSVSHVKGLLTTPTG